jgi:hypothetical protein
MVCDKLPWVIGALLSCSTWAAAVETKIVESNVSAASRAFRIEAYQNFRHDRVRYDELRQLDAQLSERWSEAGRPTEKAPEVVQWYQQARSALVAKQALPTLPELPVPSAAVVAAPVAKAIPASTITTVPTAPELTIETADTASIPATTLPTEPTSASTGSSSVPKAIGRALWNASVQTFAGVQAN